MPYGCPLKPTWASEPRISFTAVSPQTIFYTSASQLSFGCAVDPLPLVFLLGNGQVRELLRHDASRGRAGHDVVLGEVADALLTQEVLVQYELAVDSRHGRPQDGEDGVGEDGGLAQVSRLGRVIPRELLRGGGLDGLGKL